MAVTLAGAAAGPAIAVAAQAAIASTMHPEWDKEEQWRRQQQP